MDASKHVEYVKKIHGKAKEELEKKIHYFVVKANKHCKKMAFELGDVVWVHLRKERFPKKMQT
jgi:NTP pyrophosphatase (non-canonical NTP hydrolase)